MEATRKQRPEPNRRVGRPAPAVQLTPGARRKRLALRILGWSVVGGLVAIALTAVAMALVFWHYSHGLPNIKGLSDYHPKQVTVIQDRNGERIGEIYTERRTFVPFAEVPPMLVDAFVVAEDANFWNHGGIDYRGMIRAAFTNLRSGRTRHGASTITQQVVKNFVLSPERTFKRKIQEIILARRLESALTKKEILTLYMNQIYFGGGRYGVLEAARFYFGKQSLRDLDLGEIALLAGLPQAPEEISPHKNPVRAKERQTYVLNQLARHGKITSAEAQKWIDAPIQVVRRPYPMLDTAPEWVELVRKDLIAQYGTDLDTLGAVVQTSLRADVQAAAQKALQATLRAYDGRHKLGRPVRTIKADKIDLELAKLKKKVPSAGPKAGETYEALVTAVHDADNELEVDLGGWSAVMVLGGADDERWNPVVDGKRKKPSERFGKGDVLKVTIAPAPVKGGPAAPKLKHGDRRVVMAPGPEGALVVLDPRTREVWALVGGYSSRPGGFDRATMARRQPGSSFKPIVYAAALASGRFTPATIVNDSPEVYDLWKPKNYKTGAFEGPVRLRYALAKSINTVAIKVMHDVGPDAAVALAQQLGITGELPHTLSLALGSGEVTPLELTNAFASFADGGVYAPPRFVRTIDGKARAAGEGTQVVAPEVAYVITDMMRSVVEQGTATKAKSLGVTIAGKTGTSNDARDTWFIGMTPDVVIGVWVGFDDNTPMGGGEAGGVTALPAFIDVAKSLRLKDEPFARPANVEVATIDLKTGLLASPGAPDKSKATEVFIKGTAPTEVAPAPGEIDSSTFVTDEYGDEAPAAGPSE